MSSTQADERAHRRRRFQGRDPQEGHRSATPLELLYDLTLVVAFGVAADELAHFVADDHVWAGIVGFMFAAFAACWAWVSYSWFASAYDTDDWLFRLATMVQMVGVIVLALGIQPMFASIEHGDTLDNGMMVAGYVIMRAALVPLWALVARHDPERAPAARTYIRVIAIAQVGWIALVFADLPVVTTFLLFLPLIAIEMAGPFIAESKATTPWHPHHIAERYGLLVIITLGEVILGTVAALNALVHGEADWTVDAALLAIAGVGLAFGCWWMYFAVPWAEPLVRRPGRFSGFVFGYGHLAIFPPLAAMGAGVHVAAFSLAGEAEIGATGTVLSVVIPFAFFALAFYVVYSLLVHTGDPLHLWLLVVTGAILAVAVVLATAEVSVPVCLLVVMLAPAVTVVGYETLGHRHMSETMRRL
jgi:low temperature requirement protein LtrA